MAYALPHRRSVVLLALASLFAALTIVEPAGAGAAAPACSQQVIDDWSDNGRVDRVYPLDCYQQAVEALAPDIRDYTDAQETIERALAEAVRPNEPKPDPAPDRSLAAAEPVVAADATTFPWPLLALAGAGGALLAAGALSYAARRARLGRKGGAR
jgi:hypothetical protein